MAKGKSKKSKTKNPAKKKGTKNTGVPSKKKGKNK